MSPRTACFTSDRKQVTETLESQKGQGLFAASRHLGAVLLLGRGSGAARLQNVLMKIDRDAGLAREGADGFRGLGAVVEPIQMQAQLPCLNRL